MYLATAPCARPAPGNRTWRQEAGPATRRRGHRSRLSGREENTQIKKVRTPCGCHSVCRHMRKSTQVCMCMSTFMCACNCFRSCMCFIVFHNRHFHGRGHNESDLGHVPFASSEHSSAPVCATSSRGRDHCGIHVASFFGGRTRGSSPPLPRRALAWAGHFRPCLEAAQGNALGV